MIPQVQKGRVPLWKKHTTSASRRRRRYRILGILLLSLLCLALALTSYKHGWWTSLLDWAVVAIPAIAGFVAWVIPIKQTTNFHRIWLFIGGLVFSGLIFLQQWETGIAHAKEIARLATKEDIAKLPTVQQIGLEFKRLSDEQIPAKVAQGKKPSTTPLSPAKPTPDVSPTVASEQIAKGIEDIKHILGSQQWGLTADQLVTLSRRMAPFAATVNGWSNAGGDLITSILGNPDSNKFATSLIAALRSAGWNLPGSGMSMAIFNGTPKEIAFLLHSKDDASIPVLNQFAATLKEAGIPYHGEILDSVLPGQFRIIVGAKPD